MEVRSWTALSLVRVIAPFVLIAALVGLVYAPVTQIPYAPAGDDQKLLWPESSHTCCKGAFDVPTWQYLGRGLGALLANAIHNPLFEVEDLAAARQISLVAAILVSGFGFWALRRAGAPELVALVSAAGLALFPGATQGTVHAHAGIFLLFPMLLALPAGALVLEAARRSSTRYGHFDIASLMTVPNDFSRATVSPGTGSIIADRRSDRRDLPLGRCLCCSRAGGSWGGECNDDVDQHQKSRCRSGRQAGRGCARQPLP